MMYETGEAISLKEMLDKFLVFAQKYNESTVSWQLIDDRSDSFFGSTLKIPLGEYRYTGYKDKKVWMINSSDFFDNVVFDENKSIHMDSLVPMFEKMLDGSHISVVNVENKATATNLLKALKKQTDLPDVVFFGGVTETMLADGNIDSYDALVDWCKEKKIELRLFYFSHDGKNKYKDDVRESKHQFFYFRDEILNDPMEEVVEIQEEYERKNDSIFFSNFTIYWREKDVPKHFKDRNKKEEEQSVLDRPRKESFRRFMQKIDIIMNITLKTFRPGYYASFQYRNITEGSYRAFFYTKHDVLSEEINKVEGVGKRSIRGKDGIQAFNDTGEMIAVGLHMSYDRDLWMAEQGNITCEAEADDGANHMNLLPFWDFRAGMPYKRLDIPEYPGTGCPWFTISNRNKSEYGIDKDNKIRYYFSKSNKCATIVFRIMDKSRIYTDCWQTIVFGCFKYDTHSTVPPLYVAGGNQALVPDVWIYFPPDMHVNGLRYFLDMKNPCLSNSNLAYPTDFGFSHMSNFRVLGYDGKWRDVFSLNQTYTEYQYFGVCENPKQWGVPLNYPTYQGSGHSSHIHKNKTKYFELYHIVEPTYYTKKDRHLLKSNIEVSVMFSEGTDEHNLHGNIVNCYMTPDFDKESGIVVDGNDKYVLVPNGWDERLWHYDWYLGRIYWGGVDARGIDANTYNTEVANETAYRRYHSEENRYEGNERKINTKLLIRSGEIRNVRDFDLNSDNEITKNNSDSEHRRKLMDMYIRLERPIVGYIKHGEPNTTEVMKSAKISDNGYYWYTTPNENGVSPINHCKHIYPFPQYKIEDLIDILSNAPKNHGNMILQLYEGKYLGDSDLYKDATKIEDTWDKLLAAHNKYNKDNDFIVLIFGGNPLSEYSSYTQTQYEQSFRNKRAFSPLDNKIIKKIKDAGGLVFDIQDVIEKLYTDIDKFNRTAHIGDKFSEEFSQRISAYLDSMVAEKWNRTNIDTIVELQFYADGRTLLVDWGDETPLNYYTGWEVLPTNTFRHYSDKLGYYKYRTRMRHHYKDEGYYNITIYAENNDSYKNKLVFHKDNDKHNGLIQFFGEVDCKKELKWYDGSSDPEIVVAKTKFFGGLSIDGATVPRENDKKDYIINPDFYYAHKASEMSYDSPRYIGYTFADDGLVQTVEENHKQVVVLDQPLVSLNARSKISDELEPMHSHWLGSLINYQTNGRFEDIFENQDKTWWMILQRTGATKKDKKKFVAESFGAQNYENIVDFHFYEKNILEDKKSWIHIYESTFENIYFDGARDSAYLDVYNLEYKNPTIHLCKRVKTFYVDHFPEIKQGDVKVNVYSDTDFFVIDMTGQMKNAIFYCKKEQIEHFSNANPELTFKELIV